MANLKTRLTAHAGIEFPIIGGAMFPCSNPELVAAVSEAGAIGIVQPLSLTYVHGYEFRLGLRLIRSLTSKPFGLNATIERSSRRYEKRLREWVDIALQEGVRFFDTALGNPKWVVEMVKPYGGVVYHKVTERKWAIKAVEAGVDGLIAVNNRAGGHAGSQSAQRLLEELRTFDMPLICAGGIGTPTDFRNALESGYDGVLMATRFIASTECTAHEDYKKAIVSAGEKDIVLTSRVTGVPLSVIRTPYVDRIGYSVGAIARWMLKGRRTRRIMRLVYALRSMRQLKESSLQGRMSSRDYYQAGRSVEGIHSVEPCARIIREFVREMPSLRGNP